jgi:hypothetical protein
MQTMMKFKYILTLILFFSFSNLYSQRIDSLNSSNSSTIAISGTLIKDKVVYYYFNEERLKTIIYYLNERKYFIKKDSISSIYIKHLEDSISTSNIELYFKERELTEKKKDIRIRNRVIVATSILSILLIIF